MAVLYPLNLLENESWVSFGGDLYLESSAKESSEDTISPRFVFANLGFGKTSSFLGFGKTSSFFLGAGLGDIGFKTEGTVEGT